MVWLLRQHISTTAHVRNLIMKEAWTILYSRAYQSSLLHFSVLEPHYVLQLPGCQAPTPPLVQLMTREEYEVDQILDMRLHHRHLQYLVLWKGYFMSDITWELAKSL